MKTKSLLIVTALCEAPAGIGLIVLASQAADLVLGWGRSSPETAALARVAGAAITALALSCWLARNGEPLGQRGLVGGLLSYNVLIPVVFAAGFLNGTMTGILVLPGCLVHTALALWCVMCLRDAATTLPRA